MIGINFIGGTHGAEIGLSTEAGVEPQKNWNDLKWWGDPHALINGDGSSTSVTVDIGTTDDAYNSRVDVSGTPVPGDNLFMRGYYHGSGSSWTVMFSGLTSEYGAAGYDLIVYYDGANSSDWTTEYALSTGASVFAKDATDIADWDGTFVQATGTSAATATDGNYVRFTGLTSGDFTLTAMPQTGDGPINGIQIVAVPEPTAFALLSLGLAATLARRRQTRPG